MLVKSKETVGNSWTVLKVILGHKYHHNHWMRSFYIYQLQPKSRFRYKWCFLFPYIFVFDCFELASWIANGERSRRSAATDVSGLVKQAMAIKNHGKCTEKIAIWERWVVSTIVLPKSALRKRSRCYWETRSNVKGQHAPTRTDNQREKYMKKSHFVADFGCNQSVDIHLI